MTPKRRTLTIISVLLGILLVGGLLVLALYKTDIFDRESENFIKAETIYTAMIVAVLLVILVIALVLVQARQRVIVRPRGDKNVIDQNQQPTGVKEVVKEPTIIKVETEAVLKKENKEEQTDESRFFMLTQIDEKPKFASKYLYKLKF